MTDLDLAQACSDLYAASGPWAKVWNLDGIVCALRKDAAGQIVCFRGSVTAEDWADDFKGWPTLDADLGYVHDGFREDMDRVVTEVLPALGASPTAVCGHSLGAARALIFAAMLVVRKQPVSKLTAFGCPRPGFAKLSGILRNGGFPITIYRNGPDPVASVPRLIPMWQKPVPDTILSMPPDHIADPFAWHHFPLYHQGIKLLGWKR